MISADDCTGECLKSGPWGLAIVLLLCVACYFLFRSMSRHLKKVRVDFPSDQPPAAAAPKATVVDRTQPASSQAGAPADGRPSLTESDPDEATAPPA